MNQLVSVDLWAGFECGHLGDGDQDLLVETRHTPELDMAAHYRDAMTRGVTTFRDGLPWRHDGTARVAAVPKGATVIWDLCHFDPPIDPRKHAISAYRAAVNGGDQSPHLLAMNEPSACHFLCGMHRAEAVVMATNMMLAVNSIAGAYPIWYTCDPAHHAVGDTFWATDRLFETGLISCIGINYHAAHAHDDLRDILRMAGERYDLPIAITETGWHDGHPHCEARFPHIRDRREWLAHVEAEITASDVEVEAICWHPWLDQPVWGRPGSDERWPCGYVG